MTQKMAIENERAERQRRWHAFGLGIKKAPLRVLFPVICLWLTAV